MVKRFLPFLIGAGLLTLFAVPLLTSNSSDSSRSSIHAKPPGTRTLSDGGQGPAR
ncbi:MAG TPA: hypothetical protein VFR79_09470 [Nitrospira sp.]|nr:hypothetical protein [Nitrospira sp.]